MSILTTFGHKRFIESNNKSTNEKLKAPDREASSLCKRSGYARSPYSRYPRDGCRRTSWRRHPIEGYPIGKHPTGGHYMGEYPIGRHPIGGHPATGCPTAVYPIREYSTAGYPTAGYPTAGYPTGDHSTGEHPTDEYYLGGWRYPIEDCPTRTLRCTYLTSSLAASCLHPPQFRIYQNSINNLTPDENYNQAFHSRLPVLVAGHSDRHRAFSARTESVPDRS